MGARYLISRAPKDGALVSPSLDCAKTLFHKRVGSGRQVAAFSDGLTLLGLLPELPPGIVEPLAMAGPEVGGILRHRESMLVAPEQGDAARPALAHASDVELDKIRAEPLQRRVVVEIVLNVGPVVVWFCMIVWVFDVFKSGFPAPPATVIVGLFVTAIPSKSLHRQILGDGEKIPDMQEWWYVCVRENEVSLWSIGVFFEGFHVFSVPVPWQRWIILFKPIRQLVKGSADRKRVDHGSGGNAPRDHPSNVRVQRDWLALADIQMGWLWAVEKGRMGTTEIPRRCELDPSAELLWGRLLLMRRPPSSSFVWKVYVVNFGIGETMKKDKGRKLFETLSSNWAEIKRWRGRKSKSDQSGDELCLCVKVLQLLLRQYGIRIPRRSLATDAPETGAVICTSPRAKRKKKAAYPGFVTLTSRTGL